MYACTDQSVRMLMCTVECTRAPPKNGMHAHLKTVCMLTRTVSGTFHDMLGGLTKKCHVRRGPRQKKKKISNIFFFCHKEHFLLRTTPKGRESRSEARTHVHTRNRPKISQVHDATINTFIAFNEGFGGLRGVKNHL